MLRYLIKYEIKLNADLSYYNRIKEFIVLLHYQSEIS